MTYYKEYFAPQNHYYGDMYEPDEDSSKGLTEQQLDHTKEHFLAVILHLYGEGELDATNLEFSLDEIASVLGMKLPIEMPNVVRKPSRKIETEIDFAASLVRAFI